MVIRVTVVKTGNIGCGPILELLLDERADRQNLDVRVVTSGAKLGDTEAEDLAKMANDIPTDLYIVISPNAALPGPQKLRESLATIGKPVIVVSDGPTKKIKDQLKENGFGYLIVMHDPMIGARREFLDPTEMAIFNGYLLVLFADTGLFTLITAEIDNVINAIESGETPELPQLVITPKKAAEAAGFNNPYALTKAIAAGTIASEVSNVTVKACFKTKEREEYIKGVSAAHEMLGAALSLAEQAREIEKSSDAVKRTPHHKRGHTLSKTTLISKPE
ncbi:MAG: F420-dependent methylenetetrahydromethanopterin dehydrogenase [Candidatus Hodarchaeales archaeon]